MVIHPSEDGHYHHRGQWIVHWYREPDCYSIWITDEDGVMMWCSQCQKLGRAIDLCCQAIDRVRQRDADYPKMFDEHSTYINRLSEQIRRVDAEPDESNNDNWADL